MRFLGDTLVDLDVRAHTGARGRRTVDHGLRVANASPRYPLRNLPGTSMVHFFTEHGTARDWISSLLNVGPPISTRMAQSMTD